MCVQWIFFFKFTAWWIIWKKIEVISWKHKSIYLIKSVKGKHIIAFQWPLAMSWYKAWSISFHSRKIVSIRKKKIKFACFVVNYTRRIYIVYIVFHHMCAYKFTDFFLCLYIYIFTDTLSDIHWHLLVTQYQYQCPNIKWLNCIHLYLCMRVYTYGRVRVQLYGFYFILKIKHQKKKKEKK